MTDRPLRTVLDTSAVIATDLPPLDGVLAISVVTVAELQFAVMVARSDEARAERLRRLSILDRRFDALPVDDAVAISYGRLAATVAKAGRRPRRRSLDLLIAATAHAHSARLCTRNPAGLVGLEDLVEIVVA